jgi:hypothetical protein
MQEGANADICRTGNWTREGVVYVPEKGIFLTKKSPIMNSAKEATECHRNGEEYTLTPEQVEEALSDSVKLFSKLIPTKRFGENVITNYTFGKDAQKYGDFLTETGINEMPIFLTAVTDKAFARQMWFCRLGSVDRSGLDGGIRSLCYLRVRGVSESAEGTAKI